MTPSVALATPQSPAEAHRRLPPEHAARVEQEHVPLLQPAHGGVRDAACPIGTG